MRGSAQGDPRRPSRSFTEPTSMGKMARRGMKTPGEPRVIWPWRAVTTGRVFRRTGPVFWRHEHGQVDWTPEYVPKIGLGASELFRPFELSPPHRHGVPLHGVFLRLLI